MKEINSDPQLKELNAKRTEDRNRFEALKNRISNKEYGERLRRWEQKWRSFGFSKNDPMDPDLMVDAATAGEAQEARAKARAAAEYRAELNRQRTFEYRKLEMVAIKNHGYRAFKKGRAPIPFTLLQAWENHWEEKGFEPDDDLDPKVDIHSREGF